MKKIIILGFTLSCFSFFAQEAPKMPKYNAKNAANIFYYNIEEALDKSKIKKEKIKLQAAKFIRVYNDKVKTISFLNSPKLAEIELLVNSIERPSRENLEFRRSIGKKIEETVIPIRDSISSHEKKLNDSLKVIVSKKQFKKWLKHQKRKKRSLIPKAPTRQTAPMQRQQRRGRGRRQF